MANQVTIAVTCLHCKKDYTITVTEDNYNDWMYSNEPISKALNLSPADLELLLKGLCDRCYQQIKEVNDGSQNNFH